MTAPLSSIAPSPRLPPPPRVPPPPAESVELAGPKRWMRVAGFCASLVKMIPLVVAGRAIWVGTAVSAEDAGFGEALVWLGGFFALLVVALVVVTLCVQLVASVFAGTRKLSIITTVFVAIDFPVVFYGREPLLSDPSWWSVVLGGGVALQLVAFIGVSHHERAMRERRTG